MRHVVWREVAVGGIVNGYATAAVLGADVGASMSDGFGADGATSNAPIVAETTLGVGVINVRESIARPGESDRRAAG